MTTSPEFDVSKTTSFRPLLFATLIVAGLTGNYFNYPIFLSVNFLFGSICAMLALQFFGIAAGTVAAVIISSYTVVLWNHPYAMVIAAAELLTAGWLFERRKLGLVFADLLFWIVMGMPLVYLFYHEVMGVPPSNALIVMTKQAVNGIANTLAARLIFTGYLLRSRKSQLSYRDIAYSIFAFFVLCPTLILLAIGSRNDFKQTDQFIRSSLARDALRDNDRLVTWVYNRKWSVITLAEEAATRSASQMQPYLEHARRSDRNFLRIGLLDRDATITAYSPLRDELGQTNLGKNFADRPFIPVLKKTLKPMLSEIVMGRIGTPKPIVTMLAPVVKNGKYEGYVTGILALDQIKEFLARSTKYSSKLFTLIDKNGNVIMTNRTDQKVMAPFVRPAGSLVRLDEKISQWVPRLPPNTPPVEKWKRSFYVTQVPIGDLAEWKLILEQSTAPFQQALYDNYTRELVALFLILLVALALAEVLSRRFIIAQEKLLVATRDLPARVSKGATIAWPETGITEVNHLVANFKEAADYLAAHFHEIQQLNERLEQRVGERTAQLAALSNELDIILANVPVGIAKIVDRKILWCNAHLAHIFKYDKDELVSSPTRVLYPSEEDHLKVGEKAYPVFSRGEVFELEQQFLAKDGTPILGRCIARGIDPTDAALGTIWLIEDITRRREEEAEKQAFEEQFRETQRLESIGVLAGGIAHDFNNILAVIIGNCALAKMDPEKFELRVNDIEKASERAALLCRQMLEYAGRGQTAMTQISMAVLVSDMVEMLSSAGQKNIVINKVVAPELPPVLGDISQIRQIVMNLIINATEAIGEAQGEIAVILTRVDLTLEEPKRDHLGRVIPSGSYLCLEVTDNGCGMDEETRRRMFEPFFTTKFTGRGLGLSATLGIISKHEGALQVDSPPGGGTRFKVYLPVSKAPARRDTARRKPDGPVPWKAEGTVLLVEDEDQVRSIARRILEQFGFTVIEAVNGKEALEAYRRESERITLVITDIGMPVMDGYQVVQEIKRLAPGLPVVVSSGFGDTSITSRIPPQALAGMISKPYTTAELQAVLQAIVAGT